ncbi:hypothetical protein MKW92_023150 [Papaver armeniacum]|nr:hypothetical protein MKW92_023150 [Papaver armeniacum]
MELVWLVIILLTLSICAALKSLFNNFLHNNPKQLPPGPPSLPILLCALRPLTNLIPILTDLPKKYGPIITLQIGTYKTFVIASHALTHQALVQNGATFSDRLPNQETVKYITGDKQSIGFTSYGPLLKLLRRNLTSQILHPSRIKSYAPCRKLVMDIMKNNMITESQSGLLPIRVIDHISYAIFSLLCLMCFGEKMDEKTIRQIQHVAKALHPARLASPRFGIINLFPKIMFRKRWQELCQHRSDQEKLFIPLIRSRQQKLIELRQEERFVDVAYVDTLLNLHLPDEVEDGRKLNELEIVTLAAEILNAGEDTTSTALQWIMARLVMHQDIQSKLYDEIKTVLESEKVEIEEKHLQQMPYLKAVVLEGLRRHPPAHLLIAHAVAEDASLDNYVVPKGTSVNFLVSEIGRDPKVWNDPMDFKPERFMATDEKINDNARSKELKMIPFGAGRRMCPAVGFATYHLEYFVANWVRDFKWTAKIGDGVDLSETLEFTFTMKNPLLAHISPRIP